LAGGVSTYGYVGGNPLTQIDPFGLNATSNLGAYLNCVLKSVRTGESYNCGEILIKEACEYIYDCSVECVPILLVGERTSVIVGNPGETGRQAAQEAAAKAALTALSRRAGGGIASAYFIYKDGKEFVKCTATCTKTEK